jgi:hypothetical protein
LRWIRGLRTRRRLFSAGAWLEMRRRMRVCDSPEITYGKSLTGHYTLSSWKDLLPRLQGERLPNMAPDFLRELPGHCQKAVGTPPLLSTRRTWTRNFATTGARPTTEKQRKTMAHVLRWALLRHTTDLIICAPSHAIRRTPQHRKIGRIKKRSSRDRVSTVTGART